MEYITQSAEETKELGRKLSVNLNGGEVIALSGDLGAGKTTFVQGLAEGLGITSRVNSPTFIIMRTYDIHITDYNLRVTKLFHVDLYRLENNIEEEIKNLGITDLWGKQENVFIIEWAERANSLLPENTTWIKFENLEDDGRKITIEKTGTDTSKTL